MVHVVLPNVVVDKGAQRCAAVRGCRRSPRAGWLRLEGERRHARIGRRRSEKWAPIGEHGLPNITSRAALVKPCRCTTRMTRTVSCISRGFV